MTNKSYKQMQQLKTFEERFEYLKLQGIAFAETFGHDRYLNQMFYRSDKWKSVRDRVILRDEGCDLGMEGYEIVDAVIVHHINPITEQDILDDTPILYDLNNLICCSHNTHNAIHYGDAGLLPKAPIERKPFDTCPWRQIQNGR